MIPSVRNDCFRIALDGKTVRTPAKVDLALPSLALAEAIADEFQRQEYLIVPATMPVMTIASTAFDVTRGNEKQTVDRVLTFLRTDTVSFLHQDDPEQRNFQKSVWDPIRNLVDAKFGISTHQTDTLILPSGQCPVGQVNLERLISDFDFWKLTTLEIATSYAKSAVVAVGLLHAGGDVDAALAAALAEETFQRRVWGTVEGAHDLAERETAMWLAACKVFDDLLVCEL